MLAVLSVALAMLADGPAQAVQQGGTAQSPSAVSSAAEPANIKPCPQPSANDREIVICTERPEGYRLNPDVMEARREIHSGGPPQRPGGKPIPDCTAGPAPCVETGINLIGAALTAAEMAARLAKGKEVGSMFVTDPHPTEYQLYLMAKARREAEQAEEAALAKAKAAQAAKQQQDKSVGSAAQAAEPSHD